MQKKWYIRSSSSKSDDIIEKILQKRGLKDKAEIKSFLNPDLAKLNDPFLFSDMKDAVEMIIRASENKQKIMVYGDYDVDGITGTSLLYKFLSEYLNMDVSYYLPDRVEEGYGLNETAVREIVNNGYQLMITVDCGITAEKEIEIAQKNGLKTIVTDHHQPAEKLPPADALINPKVKDESYPFTRLAGVGVAFKLCQGIVKTKENKDMIPELRDHLDLVALGTVADIVSLQGENRIIVNDGISRLKKTKKPGLKMLLDKLGLSDKDISTGHIGYIIAPPLNAAGRLDDAEKGIQLLTSEDIDYSDLTDRLIKLNKSRQKEEEKTLEQAEEMIEKNHNIKEDSVIVLASKDWHQGVIGIVASRLVEKYYRPTVLIALDEKGEGKGSGRSIRNLNLYNALDHCSDLLTNFGGHSQAAGLSISSEKIDDFKKRFSSYVSNQLSREDFIPGLKIDAVLTPDLISYDLYQKVEQMRPFGINNPRPVFLLSDVNSNHCFQVGKKNQHLKIKLDNGNECIGFGMGDRKRDIVNNRIDLAFNLTLNDWKNKRNIELNLKDINIRNKVNYHPIEFVDGELIFSDKRYCEDKIEFLNNFLESDDKIAVYVNQKDKLEEYKEKSSAKSKKILFFSDYNLIKDIKIDRLVLASLPFNLKHMMKIINSINDLSHIYFIYNENDYYKAQKSVKKKYPTRSLLREFYQLINKNQKSKLQQKDIEELCRQLSLEVDQEFIENSLTIMAELELIEKNNDQLTLLSTPNVKLDLSNSLRYNKIANFIDQFNSFTKIAFHENLFYLIKKVNKKLQEEEYNGTHKVY